MVVISSTHGNTWPGTVRDNNEDSYLVSSTAVAVADGVAGGPAGKLAPPWRFTVSHSQGCCGDVPAGASHQNVNSVIADRLVEDISRESATLASHPGTITQGSEGSLVAQNRRALDCRNRRVPAC
jgi:serine/threonine protein phosphatase PrpC